MASRLISGIVKERSSFIVEFLPRSEISCARRRQVRQAADCALLRCRDSFRSWRPSQQANPAILSVPYPNFPTNLLFFGESKPTPWSECVLGTQAVPLRETSEAET